MSKKSEILDIAQASIQKNGYKAVSFREVASEAGIKSSSMHYHFPTKDDLAFSLIQRLRLVRQNAFSELDNSGLSTEEKLDKYFSVFLKLMKDENKMCLAGILASEHESLNERTNLELQAFFSDVELWLANLLKKGKSENVFKFNQNSRDLACVILSTLEGSLLINRTFADEQRLAKTIKGLKRLII